MFDSIKKVYSLFDTHAKRKFGYLVTGSVFSGIAEVLALCSIFPFIMFASNPNLSSNKMLSQMASFFHLSTDREILLGLIVGAILSLLVSNLYLSWVTRMQVRFAYLQGHKISFRLFSKYLSKPYEYFLEKNTNELSKNVLSEVSRVVIGVLLPSLQMLTKVVCVLAILLVLLVKEPFLSLVTVAFLGSVYLITYKLVQKKLVSYGAMHSSNNELRYKIVGDLLSGIKIIKLSSKSDYLLNKYNEPSLQVAQADIRSQIIPQVVRYSLEIFVYGGMLLIAFSLISRYGSLTTSLPTLALFAFAGYRMLPAMQQIFNAISTIKYHHKAIELVFQNLQEDETVLLGHKKEIDLTQYDSIQLEDIVFSYPKSDLRIIDHVSVTFPKYCTVGIVGPTGSGKTTLIDILLGLLVPQKGHLRFDDKIQFALNKVNYKKQIGYVPQDVFLIDDSIINNIALGTPEHQIDIEKVMHVCSIAQIDEYIMSLQMNYQTQIGQMGVKLSGGQRQRLGIARALYFSPVLLVLDEATSALDSQTELKFLQALKESTDVKFIVMIAHRLASIKHCDLIYYINQGKCVGWGSYDQLKDSSDDFKNLTQQQSTA